MKDLIFTVKEETDGTFVARAVGHSIFTEGDDEAELKRNIEEAVKTHFENINSPIKITLQYTRDESFVIA